MCVKQCVKGCCCCFDLKTGSKIIGWLGIVIQVITIIYIIVEWAEVDSAEPPSYEPLKGLSLSNINSAVNRIQNDLENDKEFQNDAKGLTENDEFAKAMEGIGKAFGGAMKEMQNNPDFQTHRGRRMAG